MTLDEAIIHAREVAECREDMCEECRQEYKQLAEWLEELKDLRKWREWEEKSSDKYYNKAIDEFKYACFQKIKNEQNTKYRYLDGMDIFEIAQKLKDGGENDD